MDARKIYVVVQRDSNNCGESVEVKTKAFSVYRNAIAYVNSLPEKPRKYFSTQYDIEEVEISDEQ